MGPKSSIAIVGVGLRLPGNVGNMADFAGLLWSGHDPIAEVPKDRWTLEQFFSEEIDVPGKSRARHMASLDRLDLFDAEFFGIAPREAAGLDPQQRLLLEVSWEALEDAGINPHDLAGTNTGVYMGTCPSDHARALMSNLQTLDAYASSGTHNATAVGRLSYFLDLSGPSLAVDTACSASLTAIHLAVQGLRLGECDLALAGGVNVILSPEHSIIYSKARMLSPDGRCRSFSSDAQGYVRGEGCGVLVLRRLDDAMAAGDRILGVIRGTAMNQDGRSAGLTAPRRSAQEAMIAAALRNATADPLDVSYVEAHGSGTPLGDPIEAEALGNALCSDRPADAPLLIGSVKSNIGHLEASSGVAGLAKLLLAFQRNEIPANLHFSAGNPLIDWANVPIKVVAEHTPWPPGARPRVAGVSGYGFGGSNGHLIVEEPPRAPAPVEPAQSAYLLPISARSADGLRRLAQRYRSVLASDDAPLAAICREAALGRAHFRHRIALVAADLAEMREVLEDAIAGRPPRPAADGGADPYRSTLEEIAGRYSAGDEIDWAALPGIGPRRPVSLPLYPFERRRHWPSHLRAFAGYGQASGAAADTLPLADRLARAPAARRLDMALAALRDVIGPGRDGQEPMPANASFVQAGIDPMSADLRRNLERLFGQPLAPTVLMNHSTLNDLARHLLSRVQVAAAQPPSASPPPPPPLAVDEIRAKLMARLAELR